MQQRRKGGLDWQHRGNGVGSLAKARERKHRRLSFRAMSTFAQMNSAILCRPDDYLESL
jgi:hypothetical protein